MAFEVNGNNGKYDNIIQDESVKYGRNAADNHMKLAQAPIANDNFATPPILSTALSEEAQDKNLTKMEEFVNKNDAYLRNLPPLEYEYRYMLPNGGVNKKALLGAAFEEMGRVNELPVKEFENRYLISKEQTAEPLDINKDGKIDIAEYGANILAADVLSKNTNDISKVDGKINSKGMNAVLEYSKKSNAAAAAKLYANIYKTYDLGKTLYQF